MEEFKFGMIIYHCFNKFSYELYLHPGFPLQQRERNSHLKRDLISKSILGQKKHLNLDFTNYVWYLCLHLVDDSHPLHEYIFKVFLALLMFISDSCFGLIEHSYSPPLLLLCTDLKKKKKMGRINSLYPPWRPLI